MVSEHAAALAREGSELDPKGGPKANIRLGNMTYEGGRTMVSEHAAAPAKAPLPIASEGVRLCPCGDQINAGPIRHRKRGYILMPDQSDT
eukprot:294492-Prorocentrum_minimum.AAC.1